MKYQKNLVITDCVRRAKLWVVDYLDGERLTVCRNNTIQTENEVWLIADNEVSIRGVAADQLYILGNVNPYLEEIAQACICLSDNPKVVRHFQY